MAVSAERSRYQVSLLDTRIHVREAFSCGEQSLDTYIKQHARRDVERRASVVHVLTEVDRPETIIGYYTLSNTALELTAINPKVRRSFPRYPLVSATLLGRLAVDHRFKGRGHGARLLQHALRKCLTWSRESASALVVVDALHDTAKAFYEKYGFLPLTDEPLRLYLQMETIEESVGSAG